MTHAMAFQTGMQHAGSGMAEARRMRRTVMAALGLAALAAVPLAAQAAVGSPDCAALTKLALPGARIVSATPVAAGAFRFPPSPGAPDLASRVVTLPAFYRVQLQATPTPDSRIGIEVWLPADWNGRLIGTGNGGGAGRSPTRWAWSKASSAASPSPIPTWAPRRTSTSRKTIRNAGSTSGTEPRTR